MLIVLKEFLLMLKRWISLGSVILGLSIFSSDAAAQRVYHYLNSLTDYSGGGGPGFGADTRVPNWVARFASEAGNSYAVDAEFGFVDNWSLPPVSSLGYEDAASARVGSNWSMVNAASLTHVFFTPDNFTQFSVTSPVQGVFGGASYVNRILGLIDTWESNTNGNIAYRIYEGWADLGVFADPFPGTANDLSQWRAYALGAYHQWYLTLVSSLQALRPDLDIELVPINLALVGATRETALSALTTSQLFVDNAPHGNSTFYFLAGVATYISLYDQRIPSSYVIPSFISPTVRNNFLEIQEYIWSVIQNVEFNPVDSPSDGASQQLSPMSFLPPTIGFILED